MATSRRPELRPMATRAAIQDDDMPEWFFEHLKHYPVLSTEAERALMDRAAAGDMEAKRLLVEHNLRLVMFVARRYRSHGLDYEDLVSEGTVGLMKAVEKFRPTKGNKFSTYATWWIRQAVSRAVMDQGSMIRLPVHMHAARKREQREQLATSWEPISLETTVRNRTNPFHENAATPLHDLLADPAQEVDETAAENVDRANAPAQLAALFDRAKIHPRDRLILLARADGMTLDNIGKQYRLSRERVRQIISHCLARLQTAAGVDLSNIFSTSSIA